MNKIKVTLMRGKIEPTSLNSNVRVLPLGPGANKTAGVKTSSEGVRHDIQGGGPRPNSP